MTSLIDWSTFAERNRGTVDTVARLDGAEDGMLSYETFEEIVALAAEIAGGDPDKFALEEGEGGAAMATSDVWMQAVTEWLRQHVRAQAAQPAQAASDQMDIEDLGGPPPVLTARQVIRMMDYKRYMRGYRRGQYSQRRRGGYYRGYRRGGYYRRGRY